MLAPHAQTVPPDGAAKATAADRGGRGVCYEGVLEPRHHHVQPQGPAPQVRGGGGAAPPSMTPPPWTRV